MPHSQGECSHHRRAAMLAFGHRVGQLYTFQNSVVSAGTAERFCPHCCFSIVTIQKHVTVTDYIDIFYIDTYIYIKGTNSD